jgi:hypothetical protein
MGNSIEPSPDLAPAKSSAARDTLLPQHVLDLIRNGADRYARGVLGSREFAAELARLELCELEPRGLTLLMRPLGLGAIRFLIKEGSKVREMIEFGVLRPCWRGAKPRGVRSGLLGKENIAERKNPA